MHHLHSNIRFLSNNHNPNLLAQDGDTRASIFYINDLHGRLAQINRIKTAADKFDCFTKNNPNVDSFKLLSGDAIVGKNEQRNNVMFEFLNLIGIDLSAIGNHGFDNSEAKLQKLIQKANFKFLTANIKIKKHSQLYPSKKNEKIVTSTVINRNGNDYGFIGLSPLDLKDRLDANLVKGISVCDLQKTMKIIDNEVKKLNAVGINKIILLSHMGYKKDIAIAKNISGIDIIIGGHSHDLIKGIIPGKNLIMSTNGEPVIITQVGKDGNYLGILDVVFDSNGVIKSAHNNVQKTINHEKDLSVEKIKDKYLGIPETIGYIDHDIRSPEGIAENPLASFVADAVREKSGAQIVMFNTSNVRGVLDKGEVTTRDISEILPFDDSLSKIWVSEKRIIDALNWGAETTEIKPEYLQTSGLKYTITPQNTVKDVYLENQDGTLTRLNHVNPGTEKKFTVVCKTSYVTDGFLGYTALKVNEEDIIEECPWFQSDVVVNYVKKFNNRPLKIELKDRIIVESKPNHIEESNVSNIFSKKPVA